MRWRPLRSERNVRKLSIHYETPASTSPMHLLPPPQQVGAGYHRWRRCRAPSFSENAQCPKLHPPCPIKNRGVHPFAGTTRCSVGFTRAKTLSRPLQQLGSHTSLHHWQEICDQFAALLRSRPCGPDEKGGGADLGHRSSGLVDAVNSRSNEKHVVGNR